MVTWQTLRLLVGASVTWTPGPQGDLMGAGSLPGLLHLSLQTAVRFRCLQPWSQERGCCK